MLHTLIVGSPPPVSVVRSIEDNYQPLAQRRPAGYSLALLSAIDRALALQAEDRPQTVDQLAALMELKASDPDAIHKTKVDAPGTMLVAVEDEDPTPTVANKLQRYKLPGLIAAGVLVGIGVGALLNSGGGDAPVQSSQPTAAKTATEVASAAPAAAPAQPTVAPPPEPVAQVWLQLARGDQVEINGKAEALMPSPTVSPPCNCRRASISSASPTAARRAARPSPSNMKVRGC